MCASPFEKDYSIPVPQMQQKGVAFGERVCYNGVASMERCINHAGKKTVGCDLHSHPTADLAYSYPIIVQYRFPTVIVTF